MDSFTFAIKNQLSFNKMIESQISQLAALVSVAEKGKILGNLEELEIANLVDIFNAGEYFVAPPRPLRPVWGEEDMPEMKGDLGRPVIPIHIGAHTFDEAICDLGASVNIMPKVIMRKFMVNLCCTQPCVCSLQIRHCATLREFLKTFL
jgi:hypothetical protein